MTATNVCVATESTLCRKVPDMLGYGYLESCASRSFTRVHFALM